MSGGRIVLVVALAMALGSGSCRIFRRGPKPAPATPPTPAVAAPPEAPKEPEELILPPPEVPPGAPKISQQPPIQLPKPQPPPRPPRRVRAAPKPTPPEPVQQAVVEEPKPPAPEPVPQLQQILTPEQQRESNTAIDQSLARARAALARFGDRPVTGGQATTIGRIRTFIQQADEARKTDLLAARALAERADALAQDLLKTTP